MGIRGVRSDRGLRVGVRVGVGTGMRMGEDDSGVICVFGVYLGR